MAKNSGKYDVVYFLKQSSTNEELRFSLRSLEKNWQYNEVWFYGGCPLGVSPDHYVPIHQKALTKWQRVRDMVVEACKNDKITEDFWLFNDDFFILREVSENIPPQYDGTLENRIEKINKLNLGNYEYRRQLNHLIKTLKSASRGILDYAVHKPMLINRKRMLEVLLRYPDEPMFRALYGNYWKIGGVNTPDVKIRNVIQKGIGQAINEWDFISTNDNTFTNGDVGRYIRSKFSDKSRFEL